MSDMSTSPFDFSADELLAERFAKIGSVNEALSRLEVADGPAYQPNDIALHWMDYIEFGFRSKGDLGESIKQLELARRRTIKLQEAMQELPLFVGEWMEHNSEIVLRWPMDPDPHIPEDSFRPKHASYFSILEEMKRDIDETINRLKKIRTEKWGDGTRGKDALAHKIAEDVAKVFHELRGKPPTYGESHEGQPSTPFTRTVQQIFDVMGVKTNFRLPCQAAGAEFRNSATN
jgi:hypothetical protein